MFADTDTYVYVYIYICTCTYKVAHEQNQNTYVFTYRMMSVNTYIHTERVCISSLWPLAMLLVSSCSPPSPLLKEPVIARACDCKTSVGPVRTGLLPRPSFPKGSKWDFRKITGPFEESLCYGS